MKLLILLIAGPVVCSAQIKYPQSVELTPKHLNKLEALSGKTRLLRFINYYKEDSSRQAREYLESFEDSLVHHGSNIRIPDEALDEIDDTLPNDIELPMPDAAFEMPQLPDFPTTSLSPNTKFPLLDMPSLSEATPNLPDDASRMLATATQSVSRLTRKFRDYASSEDLRSAVKQTSLKGKKFLERIFGGLNFDVSSYKPFQCNIAPTLGYRFTTRLSSGMSIGYGLVFGDSLKEDAKLIKFSGYRWFLNYDVTNSLFLSGELAMSPQSMMQTTDTRRSNSVQYFVGAGKKLLVHLGAYLTLTALYCVRSSDEKFSADRFKVRLGFQTSELLFRKKPSNYDPNR